MTNPRKRRYDDFQTFFTNAKNIFRGIADADPRNTPIEGRYSLNILPGGSNGRTNNRIVEVFYGSCPFDRTATGLLAECGAGLFYERDDKGYVLCTLYPARTENSRQQEDAILLEIVLEPKELLEQTLKSHWNDFMAYMQVTGLDGDPTFEDRDRVRWLRFSRRMMIDNKIQNPQWRKYSVDVIKYTFQKAMKLFGFTA